MENQTQYLNRSRTLDEWNDSLTERFMPLTITLIVYIIVGVSGNSIVLYVYLKQFKSYGGGRYFIPFLAVFDIIACVANCSGYLTETITPLTAYETDFGCSASRFFCAWTAAVATFTVILIAIDRYLTICRPNWRQMTNKWKKLSIGITVTIWAALAILRAILSDLTELKSTNGLTAKICSNGGVDHDDWALVGLVLVTLFLVAEIMTMSVLYVFIYRATFPKQKKEKDKTKMTPSTTTKFKDSAETAEDDQKGLAISVTGITANSYEMPTCDVSSNTSPRVRRGSHREIPRSRMVAVFIVKTIVFSICFLPKCVLNAYMQSSLLEFIVKRPDLFHVSGFVDSFFIWNYIINPVIYGCLDIKFQTEVKKMLCSVTNRIRCKI